ncbi:MAG: protein kinase domain-containing protein, partial [Pseudomonadota bacterium]
GLDYAHQQGIVHRDLKPGNIMFRRDGTALLTDFGIAKSLVQEQGATATGTILGSPHYMSPEQAQGQAVDGRTDIYSLGILLYEMLVGKRPFEDQSDIGTILKQIREPLPALPAPLTRYQPLLDRMSAKHPDQRFESAAALLAYLDGPGLDAAPGTGNTVSRAARTMVLNAHESATLIRRAVPVASGPAAPKDRLHWAAAAVLVLVMAGLAVPSWVNQQSGRAESTPAVSRADASTPPPVVFAPESASPAAVLGAPVPEQEAPKADDPEQVFRLAMAYRSGNGASRNDREAVRLLKIAADRAHPQAQFYYGLMNGQGRGVKQSYAEAAHWYELAARQGVADAQHLLCLSYALGRGVNKDRATGFAWCEIAVVYGSKEAEEALGALRRELRPQELVEVGRIKTALLNEVEEPQV